MNITINIPDAQAGRLVQLLADLINQPEPDSSPGTAQDHPELPTPLTGRDIETGCPPDALDAPLPPLPDGCTRFVARGYGRNNFERLEINDLFYWSITGKKWIYTSHLSSNVYHIQAI